MQAFGFELAEMSLPERGQSHSACWGAPLGSAECVVNIRRLLPRSPIMRRPMSTAKTTVWLGLMTRRCQSGEVNYDGHISRRDHRHLRGFLYEAATVMLTRSRH